MILERISGSPYSRILRNWQRETGVLIGGGPSLTYDQIERVARAHAAGRCRVIAVNDAYLWAPWADLLYAADSSWWEEHRVGVAKPKLGLTADQVRRRYEMFGGERCSIMYSGSAIKDPTVHIMLNSDIDRHGCIISLDPTRLATGRHSAYQAVNAFILAGVKLILLLGIDGRPAPDGQTHWSGGHSRPTPDSAYEGYRKAWSAGERSIAAAGVTVLNCSPGTFIDSFPKVPLAEALAEVTA